MERLEKLLCTESGIQNLMHSSHHPIFLEFCICFFLPPNFFFQSPFFTSDFINLYSLMWLLRRFILIRFSFPCKSSVFLTESFRAFIPHVLNSLYHVAVCVHTCVCVCVWKFSFPSPKYHVYSIFSKWHPF